MAMQHQRRQPPFRRLLGLLCCLLGLLAVLADRAAAQELVMAEGVAAIINGNLAAARDKAIDDALRKAVEQAVGTLVSSDTLTERYRLVHDKVLTRATGYVQRYEIVAERPEPQLLRVTIRAEVSRANLTNDLQALGLLHTLVEKPKVMVIIDEKVGGMYGTTAYEVVGQAEITLNEQLLAAGFNVVDPQTVRTNISRDQALRMLEGDDRAAAAAGLKYGAQVVITGKAFAKNAGGKMYNSNLQSLQATVQARAVRSDDGKVISARSAQGRKANIDELQGGALAIRQATENLARTMLTDIAANWQGEVYGRQKEITLMISGLVSYRHLAAIKTFLEKEMQGVRAVHQRSFTAGTAELMLDYGGKSSHIADELANRKFTGFRLEPTNVTPSQVDVQAVLAR
ncbi:MAG: hypothetical protein BWK76_09440 [Desulfobulbaceae bacterium A2]|nr:MAG: hypothetical protein BWK76_09440 [Desulfobulbaceae bacterium A2]